MNKREEPMYHFPITPTARSKNKANPPATNLAAVAIAHPAAAPQSANRIRIHSFNFRQAELLSSP
jgi:hypothetical protein